MSKYYTALVSNEGLDAIRSDFKVIIKADSIAQARAGAAAKILTVERATDQEIFEAGRNGNVVLNLSDMPTDESQSELPLQTPAILEALELEALESDVQSTFPAPASGSAPAWLPQGAAKADGVCQTTGD